MVCYEFSCFDVVLLVLGRVDFTGFDCYVLLSGFVGVSRLPWLLFAFLLCLNLDWWLLYLGFVY